MKRLRSEDDEKHKEHIVRLKVARETLESKLKQELELKAKDHDSMHDKTVQSLLAQLDGAKLHDERTTTVRKKFETARANVQEIRLEHCVSVGIHRGTCWNGHVVLRQDGHAHTEHHDYRVEASVV